MAIMNEWCCCNLRTGVLIIAGFSFAMSCYGFFNEASVIHKLEKPTREYPDRVKDATKSYGFRIDIIRDVATMAKLALTFNVISLIAAVVLAVPALLTDSGKYDTNNKG